MEESWNEERKNSSFQEIADGIITLDTSHPKIRKIYKTAKKETDRMIPFANYEMWGPLGAMWKGILAILRLHVAVSSHTSTMDRNIFLITVLIVNKHLPHKCS
jgi:hypothetical protein